MTRPVRRPAALAMAAGAMLAFAVPGAAHPASAVEPDLATSCARYAGDGIREPECAAELQVARDAAAKYRDAGAALRDGFVQSGECEDAAHHGLDPELGAMGEHWVRFDRMGDEKLDPREPEILLYLDAPGGRVLVGLEWSFNRIEQGPPPLGGLPHYGTGPPDAGRRTPPPQMFGGRAFDGPMQGHQPHQPWHYDLHVWMWEGNPAGIFAQYNARLSCEGGAPDEGGSGGSDPPEPSMRLRVRPRTARAHRRTRFRFWATVVRGGSRRPVAGAVVRFAGAKEGTNRRGRAVIVKALQRPGRHRASAAKRGMRNGEASVRVLP